MTTIDKATLVMRNDLTGAGGGTNEGVFEIETNVEVDQRMRSSFLLDNSLDRVLGALNEILGLDDSKKREGIVIDVGGGETTHTITFTEASGGTNSWGDGGAPDAPDAFTDATGGSARRKSEVIQRYMLTGTYDSSQPAELRFGEYNPSGGVYEDFHPVAIKDFNITVSSENEDTIEGRITLQNVGTLGQEQNPERPDY